MDIKVGQVYSEVGFPSNKWKIVEITEGQIFTDVFHTGSKHYGFFKDEFELFIKNRIISLIEEPKEEIKPEPIVQPKQISEGDLLMKFFFGNK